MSTEQLEPVGPRTAYAFFIQHSRQEYEKEHNGNPPTSFTDFMRGCSQKWDTMSETDKQHFQELANKDKIRYEEQLREYSPSISPPTYYPEISRGDGKPLNPLSSFYWFCQDHRSIVIQEHPDHHIGEVSTELGKKWINASTAVKEKYQAKAKEDLKRYENEMIIYQEQRGNVHFPVTSFG